MFGCGRLRGSPRWFRDPCNRPRDTCKRLKRSPRWLRDPCNRPQAIPVDQGSPHATIDYMQSIERISEKKLSSCPQVQEGNDLIPVSHSGTGNSCLDVFTTLRLQRWGVSQKQGRRSTTATNKSRPRTDSAEGRA